MIKSIEDQMFQIAKKIMKKHHPDIEAFAINYTCELVLKGFLEVDQQEPYCKYLIKTLKEENKIDNI